MTQDLIRVMIVDDHAVVRSGLAAMLLAYDDLELVGETDSGESACDLCIDANPDVVLMDLKMAKMDGAEATRKIRECCAQTQVIVLTNFNDHELVERAIEAGAIGYLLKNVTAEELSDAIRAASAGRPTLAPEAASALMQARRRSPDLGEDLTPRERQVLALLIKGRTNSEIAQALGIGPSTVKSHVGNLLSKLGAANRTEAAVIALQNGLTD